MELEMEFVKDTQVPSEPVESFQTSAIIPYKLSLTYLNKLKHVQNLLKNLTFTKHVKLNYKAKKHPFSISHFTLPYVLKKSCIPNIWFCRCYSKHNPLKFVDRQFKKKNIKIFFILDIFWHIICLHSFRGETRFFGFVESFRSTLSFPHLLTIKTFTLKLDFFSFSEPTYNFFMVVIYEINIRTRSSSRMHPLP